MRYGFLLVVAAFGGFSCHASTASYGFDDPVGFDLNIDAISGPEKAKVGEIVTLQASYHGAECSPKFGVNHALTKDSPGRVWVSVALRVLRPQGSPLKSSDCTQSGVQEVRFTPQEAGEYVIVPQSVLANGQDGSGTGWKMVVE